MFTALNFVRRPAAALCALLVSALPVWGMGDDWFASAWTTDHGMSDAGVLAVTQTPDGYLWVANEGGLSRFDGARFQKFPISNIATENSVVARLLVARDLQLWMVMNRGAVVRVGAGNSQVFAQKEGLIESYPRSFVEDGEGAMWLSYMSESFVVRIKDGVVTTYGAAHGLVGTGGLSLITDAKGQVWFSRGRNIGVFREGKFQTLLTLKANIVLLARAREGGLWFCTVGEIFKFEEGQAPKPQAQMPPSPDPVIMLEDRNGALWLGTGAQGLFRLEGNELTSVRTSHRDISCLAEDREGNLWVGTRGGGLNRLRPRIMELLGAETGLPVESLRSVCRDSAGRFWVVSRNSFVFRREGTNWVNVCAETNWPGGHAFCIASDPSGAVWIGMWGRGLYRYQNGSYTQWSTPDGMVDDHVRSLMVDAQGGLWLGTDAPAGYGRLQRFRENQWRTFDLPGSARLLRAMAQDAAGNVWVGTGDGHLFRINGDKIIEEPMDNARPRTGIRCLATTADGSLWIGFAGKGVARLKGGKFDRLTSAQGIRDDYISQIIDDGEGWLWFGGSSAIFKVAQKEMTDAADGRLGRVRAIVYGRGQGVPGLQAAYEAYPGSLRDSDGRLYMVTRLGLAIINTGRIRDNPDPPSVIIERMIVNGRAQAAYDSLAALPEARTSGVTNLFVPGSTLNLRPNHRKLEFEFTALSFTAPENVHFRYRLDGVDDQWVEAGTQRSATYSQLAAGTYRLHVTACNNSGLWNETGTTLSFAVMPFFWQTWWFRLSAVTALVLLVAAVVRYVSFRQMRERLRTVTQQAAVDKERARIAHDLHDDLGASLTHMTLLLELAAKHQPDPGKSNGHGNGNGHLQEGLTVARQTIKALDETVWAVNPRNNTLAELIGYIAQFAMEFLQHANIRCDLDLPDDPPDWPVSFELRHNLFLMVKESLNNVVRHAQASEVRLQIAVTEQNLTLLIADNGRGFDRLPEDTLADGVRNMRQRAEEIRGQFHIESKPGNGTRVSVVCSWPPKKDESISN